MHAHEAAGVEQRVEFGNREVDDVLAAGRGGKRQFVLGKEVRDARHVEHGRAFAGARRDTLELAAGRQFFRELPRQRTHVGRGRRRRAAESFELVERLRQALRLHGLQQVVDRVHRERFKRVAVVRRREDDGDVAIELCDQFEAGHSRHLDVEEHDVDLRVSQRGEGLFRIAGTSSDDNAASLREEAAQPLHRQMLVVYDVGAD